MGIGVAVGGCVGAAVAVAVGEGGKVMLGVAPVMVGELVTLSAVVVVVGVVAITIVFLAPDALPFGPFKPPTPPKPLSMALKLASEMPAQTTASSNAAPIAIHSTRLARMPVCLLR